MKPENNCPECSASWQEGQTCQDFFNQMLYWEMEDPANGVVHHLMVLGYHLQHPSLYSQEGVTEGMRLLHEFLENGVSTQEMRRRNRDKVASGNRTWKIKGTPANHGQYEPPVKWSMTAADVVAGGISNYCESVRAWARAIYDDLKASGHFRPPLHSPSKEEISGRDNS